jgi:hypothetical protein
LLFNDELYNGQENKIANRANTPICTSLSKFIPANQLILGISLPGTHMMYSRIKNQIMPGINLLKDIFMD